MVENSLDLLRFELISPDLYITSVGSSGSSFGEEYLPFDSPVSGLRCENPKLTDGSVDSS